MRLISMIEDTARRQGTDTRPTRISELHEAFLRCYPNATAGRTMASFASTLNFHCINMRSRFPQPRDKRAQAPWLDQPLFKRVQRGEYMLLVEEELAWYKTAIREMQDWIFDDEFDVDTQRLGGSHLHDTELPPQQRDGSPSLESDLLRSDVRPHANNSGGAPTVPEIDQNLRDALRQFVLAFSECEDISYREEPDSAELTIPVDVHGSKCSHYLLLAASIDVVTDSNHIRPLLVRLHKQLEKGLFAITSDDADQVQQTIVACQKDGLLQGWQARSQVPRILTEVNTFVDRHAGGDLDRWARQFKSPAEIVDQLARNIHYQGRGSGGARKKMWMFMRWVVRPSPDLRLWDHLSPADLMVPVDRHISRLAGAIGLITADQAKSPTRSEVETITAFARELFPDDPARIDYAFFMWGRGRSNPRHQADACYCQFGRSSAVCPLRSLLPCGARCVAGS